MSAATHPGTYGSNGKKRSYATNKQKEKAAHPVRDERQELGLEYGPVNYFMMCDPKYANDLGEVVQ